MPGGGKCFGVQAQNTAGSYMFILNTKEYRQAVEVEQCIGMDFTVSIGGQKEDDQEKER